MSKQTTPEEPQTSVSEDKRGSSVLMRFATSTGLLAVAVVVLAIILVRSLPH